MSDLILDRRWRLRQTPDFLQPVGERERRLGRLLFFVLLGGALFVLASLVAISVVMTAMALNGHSLTQAVEVMSSGKRLGPALSSYNYVLAMAGLSLFASALALLWLATRFYRRPIRSFVTAAPRFRWKLVLLGFAITLPILGIAVGLQQAFSAEALHPPVLSATGAWDLAAYVLAAVVFLFLAAMAEEMIFRGWLLQQTSAFTRSIPVLLLVNGVLFSLAHGDVDPGAFFVRALMGASWAWIALRVGGLEFGTGAHLANNLLIALFIEPVTLAAPVHEQADIWAGLIQLAIVGASVAAVELLIRSGKLEHSLTKS
ncbi:MAG: lysostaphin resistance A-like protein [Parcubacteria group bacterium]